MAAVCLMGISVLNAQFNKGKIILGVTTSSNFFSMSSMFTGGTSNLMHIGFSTIKDKSDSGDGDTYKGTTFNLSPRIGYLITDNIAAGFDINFSFMSYKSDSNSDSYKETTSLLGFGPFVRYYFTMKKVNPFLEIGGSFGTMKDKYNYSGGDEVDKQSVNSIIGGVGVAIPIGNVVKFDIMGGYASTTIKDKEDNPDNNREVLGTLGIKVGFLLYLGGQSE